MKIDLDNLSLAGQVLERQSGHAAAISTHLETYARLSNSDMGLILQLLIPINDGVVGAGKKIADTSSKVFEAAGGKMEKTHRLYTEAERTATEASNEVATTIGMSSKPFSPSSPPPLGSASNSAPSHYGEPDGNLFNQAFWDGYSAAEYVDGTINQGKDRVNDALSGSRSVTESVDVRSFLPRPQAQDPGIEDIRWSAGLIFGSVDWVMEKLTGISLLEEVTKPFSGDWVRIREASFAWKHTGDAMSAIGQNSMALLPPMASWTGKGSEAFLAAMGVLSQAHTVVAGPAGSISSALKMLVILSKEMAALILKILKRLEKKLMLIAAEAAVPVVGWAAALITAGFSTYELIQDARTAYKWINMIYDFVSGMASNVTQTADAAFRMADLYEGMARGAGARV
ncbi:MAG: hypothetical protein ACOH1T_03120 [Microbacteriaceae bacterium]